MLLLRIIATRRQLAMSKNTFLVQFAVEDIVGAYGMINYVDARTVWMDDIVKKAQADDISQACFSSTFTCLSNSATCGYLSFNICPDCPDAWCVSACAHSCRWSSLLLGTAPAHTA